ncbi:hypothetical protein [Agilicoccus flavus]|uniref:hypothetical protein n=1 Tax=Agilicoccus flavus TaxID=2775968 RepID=UPI001CF6CCF4|nr:hypothetical protein [Agilicoccus flavus]
MSAAAWDAALASMEDELNSHEAAVRHGDVRPVPQWEPPVDLGPLPPECAERVMNLVKRIGLLSTFVQFQLAATASDIEHAATHHAQKGSANRAVALFLDASV